MKVSNAIAPQPTHVCVALSMLSNSRRAFGLLSLVGTALGSVQNTLTSQIHDDGVFAPIGDLGLLSTSEFATLGHPLFPDYKVRIQKSDFCDGTVR